MGYFNSQVLTHKGLELLASAAAGSKVIFETIKAGSGTYTVQEISKLQDATDLKDCKQTFNISAIEQESEQIRLKAVINNQGLSDGYDIRELGVFAKKENGDSIMVAISIYTGDKPTYLPKYENTPVEMLLSNVLGYSGNGNFAIQYSSDVYVPIDIFKKKVEQLTNEKVDLSAEGVSEAINQLSIDTDTPKDADYYVAQNVGGKKNSYHRRPMSALWNYIKSKADFAYSDLRHKHLKSEIADFPTSMPSSDVYPWAKASSKPSYSKSEVGLGNVDNTADANKSVKSSKRLETYKQGSTTETYGDNYPVYAQWRDSSHVKMKCDNYTVETDYATDAGSASSATKATGVIDYGSTAKTIQIGYGGDGISGDAIKYIAGYTTGNGSDVNAKIKDVSKDALKSWLGLGSLAYSSATIPTIPSSLPANGGNSSTVNGHTVNSDVPSGAKFTDTVYTHPTTSGNKHIPSGGSSGQILRWGGDGSAEWGDEAQIPLADAATNGLITAKQFANLRDLINTNVSTMGTKLPSSYGRILRLSSPINGTGNDAYALGVDTNGSLFTYFGNNGAKNAAWHTISGEWRKITSASFSTATPTLAVASVDFSKYNEIMIELTLTNNSNVRDILDVSGNVIVPIKNTPFGNPATYASPYRSRIVWIGGPGNSGLFACVEMNRSGIILPTVPTYNGTSLYASYGGTLTLYAR